MTKTTKKKFVTNQLVQQIVELEDGQFIAKILASRGNNLHEVITANDENFLVSMPTKFRRTLWVRRGQFVILQTIEEGDKVRAEIVHVLDAENIAYLVEKGQWPEKFSAEADSLTSRRKAAKTAGEVDKDDDMFPPSTSEDEYEKDEDIDEDEEEGNEDLSD